MSWAKILLDEQDSQDAKLTELLQLDYLDYDCIVALEGKDDVLFYSDLLEDIIGGNFLPIICNNKLGVLNMKEACSNYNWSAEPNIVYICDKDFDDYLHAKKDGIYYTDHYSIESEISNSKVVNYIIRREISPRPSKKIADALILDFEENLKSCALHLKYTSCLMIEARSRGIHPDFDLLSISDFFTISENGIETKGIDYAGILRTWQIEIDGFLEDARRWENVFLEDEFRNWVRGKYLIQVAKKCLEGAVRKRFPGAHQRCSNFMGKEAFKLIKLAIKEIPSLTQALKPTMADAA